MVSEPCARPTSCRLGASRRNDRDRPLGLSTPLGTEEPSRCPPDRPRGVD
jgi:hypothetical protein